jgi:hypothetical protein
MPTPIDFTTAYAEAIMAADGAVTYYDCIAIASNMATDVIRAVNSNQSLSTPQGVYFATQFDIRPPETEGEIVGTLEIEAKYLPREAKQWLTAQSEAGARITIQWLQYLGSGRNPDFECRIPFYVTRAERTGGGGVILTATLPDLVNAPFGRRLMTRDILPGMAL